MTWPAADVSTTDLDAGADSAANARASILDLAQKFNQLRNHVSAFMQAALQWADATAARLGLGLANHHLVTVDTSGNVAVGGTITATGNITAYSDERLKSEWADLPPDLVERLAAVKVGTYVHGWHPGRRFVGVSAQSLQAVLPDAVQEDPAGYLSVAYGNAAMAALIILAADHAKLQKRVADLERGR